MGKKNKKRGNAYTAAFDIPNPGELYSVCAAAISLDEDDCPYSTIFDKYYSLADVAKDRLKKNEEYKINEVIKQMPDAIFCDSIDHSGDVCIIRSSALSHSLINSLDEIMKSFSPNDTLIYIIDTCIDKLILYIIEALTSAFRSSKITSVHNLGNVAEVRPFLYDIDMWHPAIVYTDILDTKDTYIVLASIESVFCYVHMREINKKFVSSNICINMEFSRILANLYSKIMEERIYRRIKSVSAILAMSDFIGDNAYISAIARSIWYSEINMRHIDMISHAAI